MVVAADDREIFLLVSNRSGESYIERREPDGTNREKIYQCPFGASIENTAAANDRFLVICETQYQIEEEHVGYDEKLLLIEIESGREETLFSLCALLGEELTAKANMQFMGVCDAGCIVEVWVQCDFETDPDDIEKSFQNQEDAMIDTVYCIPWDGSPARELASWQNGRAEAAFLGRWLFLLKSGPEGRIALSKLDPATGEEERLVEDFRDTFLQDRVSGADVYDFVLRRLLDSTLLMNVLTNGFVDEQGTIQAVYTGVCVDIGTGEAYECSLVNRYHAATVPVEILARQGDQLLVVAEITEANNPYGMAFLERKCGLISIADFLASEPNYRMIQSIRCYP